MLLMFGDGEVGNVEMVTGPMMRKLRFNSTPGQAGVLPQVASRSSHPCHFSSIRQGIVQPQP